MNQQKQREVTHNIKGNEVPENEGFYRRSQREKQEQDAKLYWANIADQYMLQPIYGGDGRVLIRIDEFKSKYACTACSGKGHTDKKCGRCNGKKLYFDGIADAPCPACTVGTSDGRKTYGYQLCEQCKGMQGTIIIPDTSQKSSDSGVVLAISKTGINILSPGLKVLVSTYSGIPFKFMDIDFKIMVEKDVLGIIKQLKNDMESINQGTFADLENMGVPRE